MANVTFKNSRVGNVIDQKGALLGGWETTAPMNVVIDNVVFHDVYQQRSRVHNECIFSQVPGLTIRNSSFRNCATMDLMVTRGDCWGQPSYGGLTLENNVFAHSVNGRDPNWHYYGFLLHGNMGQLTNVRIVNNTFEIVRRRDHDRRRSQRQRRLGEQRRRRVGLPARDDLHRQRGQEVRRIGRRRVARDVVRAARLHQPADRPDGLG